MSNTSVAPRNPMPETTALRAALNATESKWTLVIVSALENGPVRFVDLQRVGVAGISTEQLRMTLARMVHTGLVTKTRYREVPPRVEYELTGKGRGLLAVTDELGVWARRYGLWAKTEGPE